MYRTSKRISKLVALLLVCVLAVSFTTAFALESYNSSGAIPVAEAEAVTVLAADEETPEDIATSSSLAKALAADDDLENPEEPVPTGEFVDVTVRFPYGTNKASFWETNSPATASSLPHPDGLVITNSGMNNVEFTVADVQNPGTAEYTNYTKQRTNYIVTFKGEIGANYYFRVYRDKNDQTSLIANDFLQISADVHDFAYRSLYIWSSKPWDSQSTGEIYNPTVTLTNSNLESVPSVMEGFRGSQGDGTYEAQYLTLTSQTYNLRISANPEYNVIERIITDENSRFLEYLNNENESYNGFYAVNFAGAYSGANILEHTRNSQQTFKITKGAELGIYLRDKSYAEYTEYPLTRDPAHHDDDSVYDYYTGTVPIRVPLLYFATFPGEYRQTGRFTLAQDEETTTIDLPAAENVNTDILEASIYTNLDDTGSVELQVGSAFDLDGFRVWQAMANSATENYFVEPEYNYELLGDSNNYIDINEIGKTGRLQQRITAKSNGVAVVKFTYNPLIYVDDAQKSTSGKQDILRYPATDPVNTGIAVINIGGNTADFKTGIDARNDFDAYYFDRKTADYAEYSFAPESGTTVRVHDPLHDEEVIWGKAWTEYTADNGIFTVHLKEGRNIIELTNGGSVKYHVIMARGLNINVYNQTPGREGQAPAIGDTVQIELDGLHTPIQKMGTIYNPGRQGDDPAYPYGKVNTHLEYTTKGGTPVSSGISQYHLAVPSPVSRITHTITSADDGTLTGGQIYQPHFGSALGAHRNIPLSGTRPNLSAGTGANSRYFGALPDIVLLGSNVAPGGGTPEPENPTEPTNPTLPTQPSSDRISLIVKHPFGDTFYNSSGIAFKDGMTAYSVLVDALGADNIYAVGHAVYAGVYVAEINGLGEFDEGEGSGWMYRVNGVFPAYSSSLYELKAGDVVEWLYTRDYGTDIGGYDVITGGGAPPTGGTTTTPGGEDTEDIEDEDTPLGAWENTFTDVLDNAWYYGDVAYVLQNGLMNGISPDNFSPNTTLTRGMIVTILYRQAGTPGADALGNSFGDVADGAWYTDAVKWAADSGIVDGIGGDSFAPNSPVTRQDLAVILARYIEFIEYEYAVTEEYRLFADEDAISGYAKNAVQLLNKLGIINGVGGDNIDPKASATRAQVAAMIHRFCELIK